MKPIYFPFTFISKPVCKTLSACFRQTAVYQISSTKVPDEMQKLEKKGILDIRIPAEYDGEKLDEILKQYRDWINSHQGSEIAFLKSRADKIPFFDENSTRQITADIKNKGDRQNLSQEKPDYLLNAGLFLHLAQEYDMQNLTLSQDLQAIEAMEQDFIKDLKGENQAPDEEIARGKTLEAHDPGHYMTKERIQAWASLMQHDKQASGLFITSSRSVFEHLIDVTPEAEKVLSFDAVPVLDNRVEEIEKWQEELMENLEMLTTIVWLAKTDSIINAPEIPGCEIKASLTLYIVPGKTPHEFFNRYVEHDVFNYKEKYQKVKLKNTLLGLIEKCS
ncbi:MAG: hypothetical protein E3J94_00655 [Desulfobacteraceae bacterium]|nr:MAG: hypothetical protein E3J94_00655 [Desulfobacteraceae bacterium]